MGRFDYAVLVGMFAMTLLVGYWSSKKVRNVSEFMNAGKSLNRWQTGFSMAATDFGGSALVATIGNCYLFGLGGMWWCLAAAPAFLFVGLFLAKPLNKMKAATVPDYLGIRYSAKLKYVASVMHLCANIALLSSQFTIAAAVLHGMTGLHMNLSLTVAMTISLLLTIGGLRAVVNTDAFLFLFILVSVLFCVPILLGAGGGLEAIVSGLPDGFTDVGSLGIGKPLSWILLCTFSYSTNQNYVQKMVAAKNEKTAVFSAVFTAMFYVFISLALGVIGISARALLPTMTDPNLIYVSLVTEYLPAGVLGMSVAAVFAATLSTGNSVIISCTTLFMNDIYGVPMEKGNGNGRSLLLSRAVTVIIAALGLALAIFAKNVIQMIYLAGLFYSTSVFFPLILGLYWKKVTAAGAMAAMISSVLVGLLWEVMVYGNTPILGVVPSNLISVLVGLILLVLCSGVDHGKIRDHTLQD